ncbi:hypothetical protein PMI01_04043 [Caulobacter sp. AP07]|uniref:hypothetical protein n=1 Tax=Caulobacter sp. AP07 TaxID=1144304 RepID=UPI000271DA40|nr:hypothetical protein [Caulobacter sp. AP07]EJL26723.1 hypothetical protein PMI01_04043 [Caulobacter sp. AP07]
MLKSASILSAAVLAAAGLAAPASAATFTPNPLSNVTFTGNLTIQQPGSIVTCGVTLTGFVPGGGSMVVITQALFSGSWQCSALVAPTGLPWYLHPNTTTSVTLQGIGLKTMVGSCSGTVNTGWINGSPGKIDFVGVTIPGSPGACTVTGALNSSPSLTII